jgi:hypothetical protein
MIKSQLSLAMGLTPFPRRSRRPGHPRPPPSPPGQNRPLGCRHPPPNSRLHHIGIGVRLAGTPVSLLIDDRHIRVIHRPTGQLLRELILDPRRDYQPRGLPPRAAQGHSAPPTRRSPRSPPTSSARSHGQGWPQATRKGIGRDRGGTMPPSRIRDTRTPETIFNQQPENATMSRDTC